MCFPQGCKTAMSTSGAVTPYAGMPQPCLAVDPRNLVNGGVTRLAV